MEVLLAWVLLSVLVGWFWRQKGLSMGAGIAWSLVLSPLIGFVIGVVSKPDRRQKERQEIEEGGKKKCPYCAELIKVEARACRFCGREVDVSDPNAGWRPPTGEAPGAIQNLLRELQAHEFVDFAEVLAGVSRAVAAFPSAVDTVELVLEDDGKVAVTAIPATPALVTHVVRVTPAANRVQWLFGAAARHGIGAVPPGNPRAWAMRRTDFERLTATFK